jgi:hypothetical protein
MHHPRFSGPVTIAYWLRLAPRRPRVRTQVDDCFDPGEPNMEYKGQKRNHQG